MILMIHGMCCAASFWDNYISLFKANGYDAEAITLLHHNRETYPMLEYTDIMDYVKQAESVINSIGGKPIVIGHSMGGLIAQKLAEIGLAEKLVLIAPAAPQGIPVVSLSTLITFSANIFSIIRKKPFIIPFRNAVYGLMNTMPHKEQVEAYQYFVYESGLSAYEIARGTIAVNENMVTCPTLVISGEHDRAIPLRLVKMVAAKYDALYKEYSGYCHHSLVFGQGCEKVAQDILNWIEDKRTCMK